ncbi:MAG: hypothetical protein Q9159_000033 [Coniocarpon cinnabarinum]
MPPSQRDPLAGRSSLGNSQARPLTVRRRSSFLSRNSSIEQIAFADPDENDAHYNNQDTPKARTPVSRSASGVRGLAHKASLNALATSAPRISTPRPRPVRSLAERVERDKSSSRRSSPRVSDLSMATDQDVNVDVGDTVDVPGGMTGTVRFVGSVRGKKGVFAGIELDGPYAMRGKNDGDVEGVRYFSTTVPGAGIFLPAHRATKASSPASTHTGSNFSPGPTTPSFGASLDLNKSMRASSQSPQTPSLPKFSRSVTGTNRPNFSQTVGPGTARAVSPQLRKPASRPSLPRPDSPSRKQPAANITPGNRFTQSLRGGRPPGIATDNKTTFSASTNSRTPGTIRSPSRANSRNAYRSPDAADDTPTARKASTTGPRSTRAPSQSRTPTARPATSDETSRLRRELESRDKQLKEQALSLAEMEASLAELHTNFQISQKPRNSSTTSLSTAESDMPSDVSQLRSLLKEKNEKVAALTAEFDTHRADFRSTIDTLEMASTETERVYEKRVQELVTENEELSASSNVQEIATQLKGLEELVAELEEGLEDARRGEAEARSEVEFLRGEVERGRSELRREREKAAKALRGAGATVDAPSTPGAQTNGHLPDQRDDEIRGLKAIIHSLSSNPDASPHTNGNADHSPELANLRRDLESAKRERSELQGLIERKNFREEELEREVTSLRLTGGRGLDNDSTPKRQHADSTASARTAIRPGSAKVPDFPAPPVPNGHALKTNGNSASRPGTSQSTVDGFEDAQERPIAVRQNTARTPPPDVALPALPQVPPSKSTASGNGEPADLSAITADGPAPGRTTKAVDMSKWCALCERDGHDSVDCPFEEF